MSDKTFDVFIIDKENTNESGKEQTLFKMRNIEWKKKSAEVYFVKYEEENVCKKDNIGKIVIKNENGSYFIQNGVANSSDSMVIISNEMFVEKNNSNVKSVASRNNVRYKISENVFTFLINYREGRLMKKYLLLRCFLPGHEDKKPSAQLYISSGFFNCFACNKKTFMNKTVLNLLQAFPDYLKLKHDCLVCKS